MYTLAVYIQDAHLCTRVTFLFFYIQVNDMHTLVVYSRTHICVPESNHIIFYDPTTPAACPSHHSCRFCSQWLLYMIYIPFNSYCRVQYDHHVYVRVLPSPTSCCRCQWCHHPPLLQFLTSYLSAAQQAPSAIWSHCPSCPAISSTFCASPCCPPLPAACLPPLLSMVLPLASLNIYHDIYSLFNAVVDYDGGMCIY